MHGRGAGCGIVSKTCDDFVNTEPNGRDWICPTNSGYQCSHDHLFIGSCSTTSKFAPNCVMPRAQTSFWLTNSKLSTPWCIDPANNIPLEEGSHPRADKGQYGMYSRCTSISEDLVYKLQDQIGYTSTSVRSCLVTPCMTAYTCSLALLSPSCGMLRLLNAVEADEY